MLFNGVRWLVTLKHEAGKACISVGRATGGEADRNHPLGVGGRPQCLAPVSQAIDSSERFGAVDFSSRTKVVIALGARDVDKASVSFKASSAVEAKASPDRLFVVFYPQADYLTAVDYFSATDQLAYHEPCMSGC